MEKLLRVSLTDISGMVDVCYRSQAVFITWECQIRNVQLEICIQRPNIVQIHTANDEDLAIPGIGADLIAATIDSAECERLFRMAWESPKRVAELVELVIRAIIDAHNKNRLIKVYCRVPECYQNVRDAIHYASREIPYLTGRWYSGAFFSDNILELCRPIKKEVET